MNFYIETLGCFRNQVDSEIMVEQLLQAGFLRTMNPSHAVVIIINTCSFIDSATNESVDTILELSEFKKDGLCKKLVVVGCLPERFRENIIELLPEVDFFLGTGSFDKILSIFQKNMKYKKFILSDPDKINFPVLMPYKQKLSHVAYLKISEGCDRKCSYCIIPKLRGKQKSKSMNQIILEAEYLIESGVKEIILVAQDTTNYGKDLPGKTNLSILLNSLAKLSKSVWIRFLYGHPDTISQSVINIVAKHENICPYFDLPIQHVSQNILKNMGRLADKQYLFSLFNNIRKSVENAILRTTIIVGFPGETNSNFIEIMDFLDMIKFDNLGVFTYSDSEDLLSHFLPNHVDTKIALFRYEALMAKQLKISRINLNSYVGKTMNVIVESLSETNLYEGRSMMQAPEVDGITYINTNKNISLEIGSVISVRIVDSLEYDLIGEPNE